jgi:hypothetical protein
MNTMKKFFIAVLLAASLVSCGSLLSSVAEKADKVHQNMTTDEVRSVMGRADYRRFDHDNEVWEYRTKLVDGDYDVVTIVFQNGKVTSLESFREFHPNFPDLHKKP